MFTLTSLTSSLLDDPLEHRLRPRGTGRTTRPRSRRARACRSGGPRVEGVASVTSVAIVFLSFSQGLVTQPTKLRTHAPDLSSRRSSAIFSRCRTSPTTPRSSSRSSSSGSASGPSSGCASRTAAARRFSFFDGPVTANKTLAVHTAWGRTLKDVFQRYKALRGFDQRYQNGFDCQGLWIEVGVERELGLNSKREIEEYGLEEFARRCRDVVVSVVGGADARLAAARQVDGLGQRLLHVQRHEHRVRLADAEDGERRGWLYMGHRSTEWCPRCGTSISAARAVAVRTSGSRRPVALRPLPAARPAGRVARDLDDDAVDAARERRSGRESRRGVRPPRERRVGRRRALPGRGARGQAARARSSSAGVRGPVRRPRAGRGVEHRVIPWDEVSLDDGTGIVHIAPGCGGEDFELARRARPRRAHARRRGGPLLRRVRLAARPLDGRGGRPDHRQPRRARAPRRGGAARAPLSRTAGAATRRSSSASPTTGSSPSPTSGQQMLDANATVEWTPEYMGKRMDDWLRNMGDWNISRRRYYGLPLPFYPCACGHLNVIGSRAELEERALGARPARGAAPARGSTACRSAARSAASPSSGSRRSATSGSTPASSRSRRSAGRTPSGSPSGFATRRRRRADDRRPARPRVLGEVVPGRLGHARCASRSGCGSTRSSSCRSC